MLRFYSRKASEAEDKEVQMHRESVDLPNWTVEREVVIKKKFELRL